MALEQFRKLKEAEDAKGKTPEKEETGPSLGDIAKDNKTSALFGSFLEHTSQKPLAERFASRETLQADELTQLEENRKEFLNRIERAKNVIESLNPAFMDEIIKRVPELKDIVGLVGQDGIRTAIVERMNSVAIKDPDRFEDMAGAIEKLARTDKRIGASEKEVNDTASGYGVSSEAYRKALLISDPIERRRQIKELVDSQVSWFAKLTGGKNFKRGVSERVDQLDKGADIQMYLNELEDMEKQVGTTLLATLQENDDVRQALSALARGESAKEQVELLGMKEAQRLLMSEEELREEKGKEWEQFKKDNRWDNLTTDDEKDKVRDTFFEKFVKEKTGRKQGLYWVIWKKMVLPNFRAAFN